MSRSHDKSVDQPRHAPSRWGPWLATGVIVVAVVAVLVMAALRTTPAADVVAVSSKAAPLAPQTAPTKPPPTTRMIRVPAAKVDPPPALKRPDAEPALNDETGHPEGTMFDGTVVMHDFNELYKEANELMSAGKHAEAIPLLKEGIERDARDPRLHAYLGAAYRGSGDFDLALSHLSTSANLDPSRVGVYVELTLTLLSLDRLEPALTQYKLALAQRPKDTRIHEMIGVALMEHEHYEQICTAFGKAVELGIDSSKMQEIWGAALFRLGNFEGAIEHHAEAVKLIPGDADAHARLGYALETAGRSDEAITSYERAVDLDPEHAAASRLANLMSQQP